MEIKKVLNLGDEEFNKLIAAGELLGAMKKSLEAGEADEISTSVLELVSAINEVSSNLVKINEN